MNCWMPSVLVTEEIEIDLGVELDVAADAQRAQMLKNCDQSRSR